MKWSNLKKGKCPECGKDLVQNIDLEVVQCSKQSCGYWLSEVRFAQLAYTKSKSGSIIEKRNGQRFFRPDEDEEFNLSQLNNL